ncbi:hypothetical protein [Devosia sp. CN2-171]|uniref:hypothetical protein n=1 Tax=Devosia sp. CN2-171 TaxID=3400909 RepID=UPI003BF7E3C7
MNEVVVAEEFDDAIQEPVLRAMTGGPELIAMFGFVPWFHDDEIERLDLVSPGRSRLVLKATTRNSHVEWSSCRVIFEIEEIVELGLQHFHKQNALFALRLRPAGEMAGLERYGAEPSPDDIEIVLEPAVGMEGVIRCRGVSVAFHEMRSRCAKLRSADWP